MSTIKKLVFKVLDPLHEGQRLDRWLSLFVEVGSRSAAQRLLQDGQVENPVEKKLKPSYLVRLGDEYQVTLLQSETSWLPSQGPLEIIFEDEYLIVLNKPAGLVVHPSPGHYDDSLVQRLLSKMQLSTGSHGDRPGVVHRLDKDTSGLLVFAKNDSVHRLLALQFFERQVYRIYEAVAWGIVRPNEAIVSSYLNRHPSDRKKRASVRDKKGKIIRQYNSTLEIGKWALTKYKTLGHDAHSIFTHLEVKLETGRTHQIRVHMSELGYPLVGDSLYRVQSGRFKSLPDGVKEQTDGLNRVLLHARELAFEHPITNKKLHFFQSWPSDLQSLWNCLEIESLINS